MKWNVTSDNEKCTYTFFIRSNWEEMSVGVKLDAWHVVIP